MLELPGKHLLLRAPSHADAESLRAIHSAPEVAPWWGLPSERFPFDDDAQTTSLTMFHGGEVAGFIQFTEEPDPDYRHASIDLFVAPRLHRKGLGSDAIATVLRHLVEDLGHHRITIDPAVDNDAAIACYEKIGFRRVGVMRSAWRDPTGRWRDGLLMELVMM